MVETVNVNTQRQENPPSNNVNFLNVDTENVKTQRKLNIVNVKNQRQQKQSNNNVNVQGMIHW